MYICEHCGKEIDYFYNIWGKLYCFECYHLLTQ